MLPRNVWLAAPFLVLALVVASFTVTPLWIQRRTAQLREPAYRALASSVEALGALIDMRDQQHRATVLGGPGDVAAAREARQRLSDALLAYASTRGASPADLSSALQRFLVAAENRNPPALRLASERLSRLLMDELAAEQRRAIPASARLEQIRTRSTQLANDLNLAWAVLAAGAGVLAAMLVRRYQRLTEQLRSLDQERAHELEQ